MSKYQNLHLFLEKLYSKDLNIIDSFHSLLDYLKLDQNIFNIYDINFDSETYEINKWLCEKTINPFRTTFWIGINNFFIVNNKIPVLLDFHEINYFEEKSNKVEIISSDFDKFFGLFDIYEYYDRVIDTDKCFKSTLLEYLVSQVNDMKLRKFYDFSIKSFYSLFIIRKNLCNILNNNFQNIEEKLFVIVGEVELPDYDPEVINFFWV